MADSDREVKLRSEGRPKLPSTVAATYDLVFDSDEAGDRAASATIEKILAKRAAAADKVDETASGAK